MSSLHLRIAALVATLLFCIGIVVVRAILIDNIGALVLALAGLGFLVVGGWWLLTERGAQLLILTHRESQMRCSA
jgi:hypothetical protein